MPPLKNFAHRRRILTINREDEVLDEPKLSAARAENGSGFWFNVRGT